MRFSQDFQFVGYTKKIQHNPGGVQSVREQLAVYMLYTQLQRHTLKSRIVHVPGLEEMILAEYLIRSTSSLRVGLLHVFTAGYLC